MSDDQFKSQIIKLLTQIAEDISALSSKSEPSDLEWKLDEIIEKMDKKSTSEN